MTHPIDELIRIVPDHPGMRIMHFVDVPTALVDKLAALAKARDCEYQLQCLEPTLAESMQHRFAETPACKVRALALERPRYHIQAKLYDFVFVEAHIPDPEHFLKTIYTAMKNAANIFILLSSKQKDEIEIWRSIMEENYYVAFSTFDLNDTIRIVSAKKMHGWGG